MQVSLLLADCNLRWSQDDAQPPFIDVNGFTLHNGDDLTHSRKTMSQDRAATGITQVLLLSHLGRQGMRAPSRRSRRWWRTQARGRLASATIFS